MKKIDRSLYEVAPPEKYTPKWTAEYVLEKSDGGRLIYEMALGPLEKVTEDRFKNVLNPFYDDKNPGLYIKFDFEKNRYTFIDYGDTKYKGDPFDFAALYFGLDVVKDFPEILRRIMEVIESKGKNIPVTEYKAPTKRKDNVINRFSLSELKEDKLPPEVIEFISQHKVDLNVMNHLNAVFINSFLSTPVSGKAYHVDRNSGEVMIAYKGRNYAKIYRNTPKNYWWVGNKPKAYFFGGHHWEELNVSGDLVIITGGEKDVIVLNSLGFEAVCLNSETSTNIPNLLEYNLGRFETVAVFYDNDETGVRQGKLLADRYNYCQIILPEKYKEIGVKDVSDFVKQGHSIEELKTIIYDQVNAFGAKSPNLNSLMLPIANIDSCQNSSNLPAISGFRTANQRLNDALNMPPIKSLLGSFWFTNELTILFGDTGIGKSLLAVAIADKVSKGESLLNQKNETEPQKILYIDFELSDRQFLKRCMSEDGKSVYTFSPNLFIDTINIVELINEDSNIKLEDALFLKICELIEKTGATVLIVDNITYLKTQTTQDGQVALEIMKTLNQIKKEYLISILALAHTPKRQKKPITINDLAGSKHLSNFADGIFGIEVSAKDKNLRYLKQLKVRSGELTYGEDNVIVCEVSKNDLLLSFEFISLDKEINHLLIQEDTEEKLIEKAKELQIQGRTIRQIAAELGLSSSKVGRWLKK